MRRIMEPMAHVRVLMPGRSPGIPVAATRSEYFTPYAESDCSSQGDVFCVAFMRADAG